MESKKTAFVHCLSIGVSFGHKALFPVLSKPAKQGQRPRSLGSGRWVLVVRSTPYGLPQGVISSEWRARPSVSALPIASAGGRKPRSPITTPPSCESGDVVEGERMGSSEARDNTGISLTNDFRSSRRKSSITKPFGSRTGGATQ